MLTFALAVLLLQGPSPIERDAYGVPNILAGTWEDAFYYAGYAVSEDRLWQMETTRRIARGKMAEAFGPEYLASDRETALNGYSDAELQQQFDAMSSRAKQAFTSYAKGVNSYIADARKGGKLPPEYAKSGLEPEPWTVTDSVATTIRLWRMFGRGGAGDLRNLAAYSYLLTQPCKEKVLDVVDDFAWQNDPAAITTVAAADDLLSQTHPKFPKATRDGTIKQLAALPSMNLLELLPAIRLAERSESTRVAEARNVFYKTGSYAVAVGKNRSATGTPLLLSGPQMGFRSPSIVHEMSISAPGVAVSGMDVPGIPGVLIGYTPRLAWGLTSGIADTEDVFFFRADGIDGYTYSGERKRLEKLVRAIRVKGASSQSVTQLRTMWGPVALAKKGAGGGYFVRRSTYWMAEMRAYEALIGIYLARDAGEVLKAVAPSPMTFNLLFATTGGEIGYAYLGAVPIRAEGVDPRFPVVASPETDWLGVIPFAKMPQVVNPTAGLLFNWNNKPVSWWPNLDTPVWGRISGADTLAASLDKPKLDMTDLEIAAWTIARTNADAAHFMPILKTALKEASLDGVEADAARYLLPYTGFDLEASPGPRIFRAVIDALRAEVFGPSVGTFFGADNLRFIAQPTVLLAALESKTSYDYLRGRKPSEVALAAFKRAIAELKDKAGADPSTWGYAGGRISVTGEPGIPYANRGTFLQLVELRTVPRGRSSLPPGEAESGPHSADQAPLARAWLYKAMHLRPGDVVSIP